jgi:hypothetical protein
MLFVTQKVMGGVSKLAVVMPGVKFTAQTMTKIVVVGNSALQVYGVRQLTRQTMADKFDGLLIIVLPGKTVDLGFTT